MATSEMHCHAFPIRLGPAWLCDL